VNRVVLGGRTTGAAARWLAVPLQRTDEASLHPVAVRPRPACCSCSTLAPPGSCDGDRPCADAVARTRELGLFPEPLTAKRKLRSRPTSTSGYACTPRWPHGMRCSSRKATFATPYAGTESRRKTSTQPRRSRPARLADRLARPDPGRRCRPRRIAPGGSHRLRLGGAGRDDQPRERRRHELPGVQAHVADARAACALPLSLAEHHPVLCAALPGSDGVLRARW
jgi:small subunit ribosomal protein S1